MAAAICSTCGALLRSRGERIERRREYRTVREQMRLRTWKVATLCRPCAQVEWDQHDLGLAPPSGAAQAGVDDALVATVLLAFPGAQVLPPVGVTPWPPSGTELVDHPGGYQTIRRSRKATVRACGWCGGGLGPDAVEVRVEYRAAAGLDRLRTWAVGVVCRPCADARAAAHDGVQDSEAVALG